MHISLVEKYLSYISASNGPGGILGKLQEWFWCRGAAVGRGPEQERFRERSHVRWQRCWDAKSRGEFLQERMPWLKSRVTFTMGFRAMKINFHSCNFVCSTLDQTHLVNCSRCWLALPRWRQGRGTGGKPRRFGVRAIEAHCRPPKMLIKASLTHVIHELQ